MMDVFKTYEPVLSIYLVDGAIPKLKEYWSENHRIYHDVVHLNNILREITKASRQVHHLEMHALIIAAFYHDAYCMPGDQKNEEKSIDLFKKDLKKHPLDENKWLISEGMKNKIEEMIMATKFRKRPLDPLIRIFWDADNAGFKADYNSFRKVENQIREEFKQYSDKEYYEERTKFLKTCLNLFGGLTDNHIRKLLKELKQKYVK